MLLCNFSKKLDADLTAKMRIQFKLDHPYATCPICKQMYKVTQRKKRLGSNSFEIHDVVQHIKSCSAKKESRIADEQNEINEQKDDVQESNKSSDLNLKLEGI